jgi:uncharacterized damage-inducible protein DinB
MSAVAAHARAMIAYNEWANDRIFAAANQLDAAQFARVSATLAHMLGTQRWWLANWTAGGGDDYAEPAMRTHAELRDAYAASHAALRDFAAQIDDDGWQRAEAWWKRWGVDATAPLGDTLFQVVQHGIHHRGEVSVALTGMGSSPGDLDYLVYLRRAF